MEKNLPIFQFRNEIVSAINNNSVVVITAETGAGKSTQVPQYLLDEGYDLVVTQPRRLAARTVAQRVAEERGEKLGGIVGYRTAVDRQDSPATRCLFCTDGLALVRELMGQNKGVLVLDEVHEWNENMEVLVAWANRQIREGVDFKVVIMSATMESEKLSAFFDNAPVISVPGRLFPVEERKPGRNMEDDIADLVREGRNVLVFQPGKAEIKATCEILKHMQVNAEILPLHGELTPEEQAKCFKHYGRPKVIVSTNVAQTSVTIDDIDAVVDSGMERRIELVDGVEGLYLKPISLADSTQRKGRAGRTKAGIYIDHCPYSDRPDFPVAEILRKRLDQTVLRLAIAGFDMEELDFFHQPDKADIADARKTLVALGCMTEDGKVTKIGKLVNRLPVSVQYARMLVEADRLGVVDDILTVAAILEMGGITVPPPSHNYPDRPDWRRMVPNETESDVMGQLAVWEMAKTMTKDEMREKGIALRRHFRAKEIRKHLADALKRFFRFGSTGRREDILKAVCAGMVNHLYHGEYGVYRNGEDVSRKLGTASLVRGGEWLVALPFDLQIKTRRGMKTLHLIQLASKVNPMWLAEVAPQLVRREEGLNPTFDPEQDSCVSTTKIYFNGQMVKEEVVASPKHKEAEKVFIEAFAAKRIEGSEVIVERNAEIRRNYEQLWIRSGGQGISVPTQQDECELYERELLGKGIVSVQSFERELRAGRVNVQALFLAPIPDSERERIERENPETVEVDGRILAVSYSKDSWSDTFYAKVEVDRELAYSTKTESVVLPSGRQTTLVCDGHSANTFPELVEKLEKARIKQCWAEARSQHQTGWTTDVKKVVGWLDKVDSRVEVTRADNGSGDPVYGYVGLKCYSGYSEWQLFLADTKEQAEEETRKSLEVLLKTAVKEYVAIPKEEPWQKYGSWHWKLTDLGRALQARFEQLVREHAEDLTPSNIKEKIEALKTACEQAKLEVGGEHAETQQFIESTEKQVETLIESVDDDYLVESEIEQVRKAIRSAKDYLKSAAYDDAKASCKMATEVAGQLAEFCVSRSQLKREAEEAQDEVADELYALQYGEGEFVDATDEERSEANELYRDIYDAFSERHYEVVLEKVEDVRKLIARVRTEIPARQAARRARFPEAVWEAVGDDENLAEAVVELANAAADFVGAKKALSIFKQELNAPYGCLRRQNGVRNAIYQIAQTDVGEYFLNLHRARDVDKWLTGAVAWLENELAEEKDEKKVINFSPPSADSLAALAAKFAKR